MSRRTSAGAREAANPDSKSARTRARLLDATAAVLSRRGFAGTRLSDIADEASVQAPAIYYYFSSRETLIEAVMFAGASGMHAYLVETLAALPDAAPPAERISAAVEAHLRHELEQSDYARALVRNANQIPEPYIARAQAEIGKYYDIWRGLVEDLERAGQLRDGITPSAGRMIVLGALNWTVEWWNPERGSLDDLVATAQSMVLHALRP